VGEAVYFHTLQHFGEGTGQVEGLLWGEGALFEHHFGPGGALDPGHQDGVNQIRVLAEQVSVLGAGQHGAAADGQAGQVGEGGEFLGLRDEGGGAEAGFEDFEGHRALTPSPSPTGRGE
jgi:hypothetical protein